RRPKSLLFNPDHLRRAHDFYEKHGGKTIVIARFMPIIRTFAPIVAGMGRMNYRRFVSFNVFGGILWVISMTGIGYFLGQIPGVREHIEIVIVVVVFLSILPGIIAGGREWMKKRKAGSASAA
ncbi:MAG TPA: VTT domain-containing protein, partial [Thermoanaerobaculia bacterium]|nr:VTT domain-containing protein [Thermoanaerobaculia bacterium]